MPPLIQPVLPAPDRIPFLQGMDPQNADALPTLAPANSMGAAPMPTLSAPSLPQVETYGQHDRALRQSYDEGQLAKLDAPHLGQEGSSHPGMFGKVLHVLGQAGGIALTALNPNIAALTPGTQLHNGILRGNLNQDLAQITQEGQAEQQGIDADQQAQAQTAYTQARPQIEQAKILQKLTGALAPKGIKATLNPDGTIDTEDDVDSQAYKNQQALQVLHEATADKDNINAEIAQNHYVPGTPEYIEAQRKLAQIDARLHLGMSALGLRAQSLQLGRANYAANNLGMGANGAPLPGAMVTDDGQAVGSHFANNVRPTGAERGKADMAYSAEEQLNDITSIMQRNPNLFGPGYGQTSAFKQWLGAQSPDAQRFMAARTIAGDHLAGTFGGRSEAALTALDNAIGQFKDNPTAAMAGINQLTKANTRFEKAGTVRTVGSQAPTASAPQSAGNTQSSSDQIPPSAAAQLQEGVVHTFGNGQQWTKKAGKPVRVK